MSESKTKELVREYVDAVWNNADMSRIHDLTANDFRYHLGLHSSLDRTEMVEFLHSTHAAFPDWRVDIVQMLSEGESVAIRWQGQVTHLGVFHGIPPTGHKINVAGINLYRLAGGLIAEEWEQTDSLSMLQQMGAIPPA